MKTKSFTSHMLSEGLRSTRSLLLVFSLLGCSLMAGTAFAAGAEPQAQDAKSEQGASSVAGMAQNLVNINSDSAKKMAKSLKGIGLAKAQAIVQWREKNGEFSDVNQLLAIKGIGKATLLKNKELIRL